MKIAALPLLAAAALLAGCGERADRIADNGVRQTKLAGHVSAGGATSGQVVAAAGGGSDRPPAGTPGTPQGMEGNTGGTELGGTSGNRGGSAQETGSGAQGATPSNGASGTADTPAAQAQAPDQPASAAAAAEAADPRAEAQRQERLLAAAMDHVAAHWRSRGAAQGQTAQAGTRQAHAGDASAATPPAGIRSEKHGTAPPSEDVKQPGRPAADPYVGADAPDAVTHR